MEPALYSMQPVLPYSIDPTVFIGDPTAPTTSKITFQRFRLTNTFEWRSQCVFNKIIDALEDFFILLLPI